MNDWIPTSGYTNCRRLCACLEGHENQFWWKEEILPLTKGPSEFREFALKCDFSQLDNQMGSILLEFDLVLSSSNVPHSFQILTWLFCFRYWKRTQKMKLKKTGPTLNQTILINWLHSHRHRDHEKVQILHKPIHIHCKHIRSFSWLWWSKGKHIELGSDGVG